MAIATIGNQTDQCCVSRFNFISPLFYDDISPPSGFRIYRAAGKYGVQPDASRRDKNSRGLEK
jgi:hypothetical protein